MSVQITLNVIITIFANLIEINPMGISFQGDRGKISVLMIHPRMSAIKFTLL